MHVPAETRRRPRAFLLKSDFMDSRFVFVVRRTEGASVRGLAPKLSSGKNSSSIDEKLYTFAIAVGLIFICGMDEESAACLRESGQTSRKRIPRSFVELSSLRENLGCAS